MPHYRGRVQSTSVPERFRPLLEATAELAERFADAGHTLYVVGGSVRDALFPAGAAADPDFDLTTDARPGEIERLVHGWADDVWTQGARFGTIGCRRAGAALRDHHAPRRGLRARLAQARGHVRRRRRAGPVAARLHHQRAGPAPARHGAGGPLRRPGRSGRRVGCARRSTRRSPSATTPCACCAPHASWPASHSSPTPRWSRPSKRCTIVSRSCRASASATSWTRSWCSRRPPRRCGSWCAPAWRPTFSLSSPAWRSSRTPSTVTRTCWRTRWPWWTRRRRIALLRLAALFHDVGKPRTRAITEGGVSFHHHEVVGARMTRTRMEALRYSADDVRHRGASGRAPPALPHLPPGVDRQGRAPLRARCGRAPRAGSTS